MVDSEIESYLYETLKPLQNITLLLSPTVTITQAVGQLVQKVGPSIADDIKTGAVSCSGSDRYRSVYLDPLQHQSYVSVLS